MLSDDEKEYIAQEVAENIQEAREAGVSEKDYTNQLESSFELLLSVHNSVCTDSECVIKQRQELTRKLVQLEFQKEFIPTPKITEEDPLSFEEKEKIRQTVTPRIKWYIKANIPEEDCKNELEEFSNISRNLHKQKCAAPNCMIDETIEFIIHLIHEEYMNKTSLSVEEILRLAEEKLKGE
ncbi:MAG TPA: hypothetical protein VNX68_16050 [Nitrosopumilaceae archaeon]|jgi:hypothetical protein|nr:hypothetical protein [Nitrosopumilaceae archaeon]